MRAISILGRVVAGLALGSVLAFAAQAEQTRALTPVKPAPNNERRTALVIGNSAYKSSPLRNPVNDARAMAKVLTETGFSVILVEDAGRATMRRVIREWGDQLARGGVGLFYYAGHGMQIRGKNYLIPVTADVQREDEVEDESVDVNTVLSKMESAKNALNLLILDACRNNPFQRSFRSGAQGLAQMDAPTGTLISFATAPGSVAADGTGENGLYTHHLLSAIRTPGLPVEQLFKQVRIGVTKDTADKQVPWESSSLRGDFFFLALPPGMQAEEQRRQQQQQIEKAVGDAVKGSEDRAARERTEMQAAMEKVIQDALAKQRAQLEAERKGAAAAAPAPAPAPPPASVARIDDRQIELAFWDSIKGSTNPADFSAYLERYPQGAFAPLARNRVSQLAAIAETKAATAASPAPAPALAAAVPKPVPPPVQLASISPAPAPTPIPAAAALSGGARWQYSGFDTDNRGNRFEHLVERQGSSAAGVLEVLRAKDGSAAPWVFTATPTLVNQSDGWTTFSPLVSGGRIEEGMSWSGISLERLSRCDMGLISCSGQARVTGREKVAVKAGTFDALKVVVQVILRPSFGGSATREITYWYAPEVQRVVKYASRTLGGTNVRDPNVEYELVAYQVGGGPSAGTIDRALAEAPAAGAAVPILVASASPTSGAIAMAGTAIPRVGDRWEYQLCDLSGNQSRKLEIEIYAAGPEGIVENVTAAGGGVVSLQHGPGLYLSGAAFVQFAPYLLAYEAVERAALSGDITVTQLADCTGVRSCSVTARIVGKERVTVPAGSFEATKLLVTLLIQNSGAATFFRPGQAELSVWYVPEVRRVVRMTGSANGPAALMSNFELTLLAYKLQ